MSVLGRTIPLDWLKQHDVPAGRVNVLKPRPVPKAPPAPRARHAPNLHRKPRTRILFLTHYFPPEGNAPASRVYEMCKRWVRDGHSVTVITGAPNHPSGVLYPGYHNWPLQQEYFDGIRVLRVWTFLAANKGKKRRTLNFLSYMIMSLLLALYLRRPDVLIATSPQFFCGWSGVLVAALKRLPFILEIRDIWPESISAVGASKRNILIWLLERMERQMYDSAFRIVTVGEGYKQKLIERKVPASKIEVVTNGVDRELFVSNARDPEICDKYSLGDRFVCSYVGTIGMASGLDVALRAAKILKDKGRDDVRIMLVGDGAIREDLENSAKDQGLDNVIFTGRVDKKIVPRILASTDACLVHLREQELFESVLPSKIFEAAGMAKPIILGVRGCAAELVQEANCGICIEPEDENALVAAIEKLAADRDLARRLGQSGNEYVHKHFDRDNLSRQYFQVIRNAIESCPIVV
jgi:hypothetical protein